jgi:type I restriction enzyme S subunit
LSAKDVRNDTLLFENGRQITESDFIETHRRTDLKPGDICLINTGATIGRMAFAPEDDRTFRTTFQKSVAVIKTIPESINNKFCAYLLKADLKSLVKISAGTAVPNLLLGDMKKHKISLPKSLKEQEEIVEKLDLIYTQSLSLQSNYQRKLDDLEELKKSILHKAFNGEL